MAIAKRKFPVWAIVLVIVVIIGLWLMSSYNTMVSSQQAVNNAWGQVETEYQRRFDLIPNLENIVQGASDFEQSTLLAVTEARTKWLDTQSSATATTGDQIAAAQNLDGALSRLLVTVEAYPTLTATDTYKTFQVQLEGTENRVTVARQDYNDAATNYNIVIKSFPANIVAGMFGFSASDLFASDAGASTAPTVQFNNSTTTTGTSNQ